MLLRFASATAGLFLASYLFPGIELSGLLPAVIAVIIIGMVNVSIKPVLLFLTFPVNLVTLGLFGLLLNAGILWTVAKLVEGFTVEGFFSALGGALLVSFMTILADELF
jgi:putative membrane protein